jgi:hypothetical protein
VPFDLQLAGIRQVMPDDRVDLCPTKVRGGTDATVAAEDCDVWQYLDRVLESPLVHVLGEQFDLGGA